MIITSKTQPKSCQWIATIPPKNVVKIILLFITGSKIFGKHFFYFFGLACSRKLCDFCIFDVRQDHVTEFTYFEYVMPRQYCVNVPYHMFHTIWSICGLKLRPNKIQKISLVPKSTRLCKAVSHRFCIGELKPIVNWFLNQKSIGN